MGSYRARKSARARAASQRNATRAHQSRIRRREPRSVGRVRPARRASSPIRLRSHAPMQRRG